MSDKQIVYIITSGSYSDYGINAVFLDKEQAEAFVRLHEERADEQREIWQYAFAKDHSIEEWTVGELPSTRKVWMVWFDGDGSVNDIQLGELGDEPRGVLPYQKTVAVSVEADDKNAAIKSASEMRAQYLATANGMT